MRNIFLTGAFAALALGAQAQSAPMASPLDSLEERVRNCYMLIENEELDKAVTEARQLIELVKTERSAYDTLLLRPATPLCIAYNRQNDYENLMLMRQECLDVFEKGGYTDHVDYPYYIALKASTYWQQDLNAQADSVMQLAMALYDERMTNNDDMAFSLGIQGRIKYDLQQYDAAIMSSQRALNIYALQYEAHDQHIMHELGWLKTYYELGGYERQMQETQQRIEQLEDELEHGFVADVPELNTAELCDQYRREAFYAAKYMLNHYLSAEYMAKAASIVMDFTKNTDEVSVIFGEPEMRWMDGQKSKCYVAIYLAACMQYAMTTEDVVPGDQYQSAIIDLVNYYHANKELTGEVEAFEEYMALYAKGADKLFERLERDYKSFAKQERKGKTTKIK